METALISKAAGTWRAPLSVLQLDSCLVSFLHLIRLLLYLCTRRIHTMAFTYQVNTSIEINAPPEAVRRTVSWRTWHTVYISTLSNSLHILAAT